MEEKCWRLTCLIIRVVPRICFLWYCTGKLGGGKLAESQEWRHYEQCKQKCGFFCLSNTVECTCCNVDLTPVHQKDSESKKNMFIQYVDVQDALWKKTRIHIWKKVNYALSDSDFDWWCGYKGHYCRKDVIDPIYWEYIAKTSMKYLLGPAIIWTIPKNSKN